MFFKCLMTKSGNHGNHCLFQYDFLFLLLLPAYQILSF